MYLSLLQANRFVRFVRFCHQHEESVVLTVAPWLIKSPFDVELVQQPLPCGTGDCRRCLNQPRWWDAYSLLLEPPAFAREQWPGGPSLSLDNKQAVSTSSVDGVCSSNAPSKLGERQLAKTGWERQMPDTYYLPSYCALHWTARKQNCSTNSRRKSRIIIFEAPIFSALARTSSQSSCCPTSARKQTTW